MAFHLIKNYRKYYFLAKNFNFDSGNTNQWSLIEFKMLSKFDIFIKMNLSKQKKILINFEIIDGRITILTLNFYFIFVFWID